VPARVVRMLNSADGSQTDRSKSLKDGLVYLCNAWSREFSTVKLGLQRSFWLSNSELVIMIQKSLVKAEVCHRIRCPEKRRLSLD
jgi:hypothetical protein